MDAPKAPKVLAFPAREFQPTQSEIDNLLAVGDRMGVDVGDWPKTLEAWVSFADQHVVSLQVALAAIRAELNERKKGH